MFTFFVQSAQLYCEAKVVKIIKSVTASEIFKCCPQVKTRLWGGEFLTDEYFIITVGRNARR